MTVNSRREAIPLTGGESGSHSAAVLFLHVCNRYNQIYQTENQIKLPKLLQYVPRFNSPNQYSNGKSTLIIYLPKLSSHLSIRKYLWCALLYRNMGFMISKRWIKGFRFMSRPHCF